jgi:phosphoenolpyruvate carboxykinase (GTP)
MGPIGSEFSKIGVELTDSIYVVLNMRIMTRMGQKVLDILGTSNDFTKGLHSKADLSVERRYIMHFPEDNTIWSVGSGYGGNVLLGKKCLALRIGSYLGEKQGWMAEHMLILGVEHPNGKTEYVAAAFPSACGKTNLAMLAPPEGLKHKGYKIWTVGDDIAWMKLGPQGELRAINPENGFFGVLPGTSSKSNLSAIQSMQKNTLYTNVLLKEDNTVWWEGGDGETPEKGIDWRGNEWTKNDGTPGAHPNSRFTAPLSQCPTVSDKVDDPNGVEISAMIFGGRRAHLAPLVYEAYNWEHGVYIGATMASEKTAAATGGLGEVRRDPMAMLPFCGYNIGDYFQHWLNMGQKISKQPKIFHVNWFRQDADGKFMWPGFGENLRVIEWILARCRGEAKAKETAIGYIPNPEDLDLKDLDISKEVMEDLLSVDTDAWKQEVEDHKRFLDKIGEDLPAEIREQQAKLQERLEKSLQPC